MAADPPLSSLIFSSASTNFSQTLTSLSTIKNSVRSRLRSIRHDASFVLSVPSTLGLAKLPPLIANARAGEWYIEPSKSMGSVYFKSTDGHHLNWSFSTRRLNLHLLPILGQHGQAMIVDTTRRGKVMPDALSKSIPIWIAVFNQVLFPDVPESHRLVTPPQAVGASEHAQIDQLLPGFAEKLRELALDVSELRQQVLKPIRPVFLSPNMVLPLPREDDENWNRLALVSTSRLEVRDADEGYVQGAADDAEHWALGLTPRLFWENEEYLLDDSIGEAETEKRALEVVAHARAGDKKDLSHGTRTIDVKPTAIYIAPSSPPFYVISLGDLERSGNMHADLCILCCEDVPAKDATETESEHRTEDAIASPRVLKEHCPPGKLGSRALREALPRISAFITRTCRSRVLERPRILYACASGRDVSVGVALAMVCRHYDDAGNFAPQAKDEHGAGDAGSTPLDVKERQTRQKTVDKTFIRRRLVQIQQQMGNEARGPSRSTLTMVNRFLMERPLWA